MKKSGLILLLFCLPLALMAQDKYQKYIDQYKDLAVQQMQKYKIPASITLAQGLLESGAGTSDLARMSNNHFGIKCGSDWKGRNVRHDDDRKKECFRYYDRVQDSYEDHSRFLHSRTWYAPLFQLDIRDYKGWAHGLKQAGYATHPQYATRLIALIEKYQLYKYDTMKSMPALDIPVPRRQQPAPSTYTHSLSGLKHDVFICNSTPFINVVRGDDLKKLSKEFRIREAHLLAFNDLPQGYILHPDERIYLKKKKNHAARGDGYIYIVRPGDSMHSVSQLFGIRLKKLYKLNKNKIDVDSALQVSTILRIH